MSLLPEDRVPLTPILLAASVVIVGILAIFWIGSREGAMEALLPSSGSDAPSEMSESAPPEAPVAAKSRRPAPPSEKGLPFIEPGRSLVVNAADYSAEHPLVVGLKVGVPHLDNEPLPVRIIPRDREMIETEALPSGNVGTEARLEVPAEWLVPGQYLIMIGVRERSALPGRRYKLEVR